jgi:hypothetical protein
MAEALGFEGQPTFPYLACCYLRLAEAQRWEGRLDLAVATLQKARDWSNEHPAIDLGPGGIFRDDQRIDYFLSLAELHVDMNKREQARSFARQAEALLDRCPFPPPPQVDAFLLRYGKSLATSLDHGDYGTASDQLQMLCAQFEFFLASAGEGVSRKMRLERLGTRLADLNCNLGEAQE